MDLYPDLFGPGDGDETERLPLKVKGRIGGIMDDNDVAVHRKADDLLKESLCGSAAGGVVRIIEIEEFCMPEYGPVNGIQVRQKAVFLSQREIDDLSPIPPGMGPHHRIAGNSHQGDISPVDQYG